MRRELEFQDDKSAKFWSIELEGSSHTVNYGRIGTSGQTKTKEFSSAEEALKSLEKLVAKKLKKGYLDRVVSEPPPAKSLKEEHSPKEQPAKQASPQDPLTESAGNNRVRWEDLTPGGYFPGRGGRNQDITPVTEEKAWEYVRNGLETVTTYRDTVKVPEDIAAYLGHENPPTGPLDFELHVRIGDLFLSDDWLTGYLSSLCRFWLKRESLNWTLDLVLQNSKVLLKYHKLFPIRALLAEAEQSDYDEMLSKGQKTWEGLASRGGWGSYEVAQARAALLFFFPDQRPWYDYVRDNLSHNYYDPLFYGVANKEDVEHLLKVLRKNPRRPGQAFFGTLLNRLGIHAEPLLLTFMKKLRDQRLMGALRDNRDYQEGAAKKVALIESPGVADFFARKLSHAYYKDVAADYLRSVPHFAIPALKDADTKASKKLLLELGAQPEQKPEPPSAPAHQPSVDWEKLEPNYVFVGRGGHFTAELVRDEQLFWTVITDDSKETLNPNKMREELAAYLASEAPPAGALDPDFQAELGDALLNRWRVVNYYKPYSNLLSFWVSRESFPFALDVVFSHFKQQGQGIEPYEPLREELAQADDDTWNAALVRAQEFWDSVPRRDSWPGTEALELLVFLFPSHRAWREKLLERCGKKERPTALFYSVNTAEDSKQLMGTKVKEPFRYCETKLIGTLIDRLGPAAHELVVQIVSSDNADGAKLISILESSAVATFFATKLGNAKMRKVAFEYLRSKPDLAIPALWYSKGKAAKELLNELKPPEMRELPEPEVKGLPTVLYAPPWEYPISLDKPELPVLNLTQLEMTEMIHWDPEMHEYYRIRGQKIIYSEKDYLADFNHGEGKVKPAYTAAILIRYGVEALPGCQRATAESVPILTQIQSPQLAFFMAQRLSNSSKAGKAASRWIWRYPEETATGLLPVAFGADKEAREVARAALLTMYERGQSAHLRAVAQRYGQETVAALESLFKSHNPLQAHPRKMPALPKFWIHEKLPQIKLKTGAVLPPSAIDNLGKMLRFTLTSPAYAGLADVKKSCCTETLDRFAWALFELWLDDGGNATGNWAFYALGHLGSETSSRLLPDLITEWQRDKKKGRAQQGIEVLGLIGTDLALDSLARIAHRSVSPVLRAAAAEELELLAARRGITREELDDRTAPDLGLNTDGKLVLELGSRTLTVNFDEKLTPVLTEDGSTVLKFPKAGKADNKELFKQASSTWKQLKKDAKAAASGQLARLERALVSGRIWTPGAFRRYFLEHPLMIHLARRLVWVHEQDNRTTGFRLAEDGTLADIEDNNFELPQEGIVTLPHPARFDFKSWGSVLADYELIQPFPQIDRTVLSSTELADAKEWPALDGLEISNKRLVAMNRTGWVPKKLYNYDLSKQLSNCEVILGTDHYLPPAAFINDSTKLGKVRLTNGLTFGELDPVEYSELMIELRAFVGEA